MSVQPTDQDCETDASATRETKHLDIDAAIKQFALDVVDGHRAYTDRFGVRSEAHHKRACYTDARGVLVWMDVTFDHFDVTREVRQRVDGMRSSR